MMNTVKEFEAYASVMRTEQMPLAEVIELFREQPKFAEWYKQKYFSPQEQTSQSESE